MNKYWDLDINENNKYNGYYEIYYYCIVVEEWINGFFYFVCGRIVFFFNIGNF